MGTLQMSRKERRRLVVLSQVQEGKISLAKAAELLGLSYRQMKRVWSRHQREGDGGVVHRFRGRRSNRQAKPGVKEQALRLYREKYDDYGVTLAAECLARKTNCRFPVSTLRRWLLGANLWERRRTRKPHRRRRARKEHFGELVQMDGSYHDWFEGRRGWAVLMVMIDDATGRVFARFFENESWQSATTMFRELRSAARFATGAVRGPARDLSGGSGGHRARDFGGKRASNAVRPSDGGVGGRTDFGAEPAGQRSRGADEWHLTGSLGEGPASVEDSRPGASQYLP